MWLTDVFFIVGEQQWSSTAQRRKIYQAVIHTHTHTHTILVSGIYLFLVLGLVDNNNMIEYHQTNPLMERSLTGLQSAINGFTAAQLLLVLVHH